jgi:hypothetical protein
LINAAIALIQGLYLVTSEARKKTKYGSNKEVEIRK